MMASPSFAKGSQTISQLKGLNFFFSNLPPCHKNPLTRHPNVQKTLVGANNEEHVYMDTEDNMDLIEY